MFVAMMQMFGLVRSEPTKGKQLDTPDTAQPASGSEKGITSGNSEKGGSGVYAAAAPGRKPEVKAPAKKTAPAAKKPAAKAAKAAAPAAKPPAKAAARPVAAPAPAKKKAAPAPLKKAAAVPISKAKAAAAPAAKPAAGKAVATKAVPAKAVKAAVPSPVPPAKKATVKPTPAVSAAPAPTTTPVVVRPAVAVTPSSSRGGRSGAPTTTVAAPAPAVASSAAKASYTMPSAFAPLPPASVPHPVPVKKDPKLANNWKTKSAEELADAEVLAMPDSEYMNDKQMAFFRLKLVRLKQDILANAGETTEHLREETVVVPDPADRATIEEEHALELRTRDRERKLLKKIEQSIVRIDAGDYGYCDETGEPIGVGRLLARPTATLSLEAQQRRELKQKMFGD